MISDAKYRYSIYRPRDKGYDFSKQEEGGEYCQYHGYGAACSLVEIDVLTGEHQVFRGFLLVVLWEETFWNIFVFHQIYEFKFYKK